MNLLVPVGCTQGWGSYLKTLKVSGLEATLDCQIQPTFAS